MKSIAIIIVNFNSETELGFLLSSMSTLEGENVCLRIYVLDSSGELFYVSFENNVRCVRIPENRGYAYALNVGLKNAKIRGCDYVWILNPDIKLEKNSLVELLRVSEVNPEAVVGSMVYSDLGGGEKEQVWGCGGYISESAEVRMGEGGSGEGVVSCDYVPGCSMFFPLSVMDRVGFFPEEYFLYFEETDWCLRAKELGVKMLIAQRSVVYHKVKTAKMEEPFRVYFYNRGQLLFKWRNRERFKISGRDLILKILKESFKSFKEYLQSPPDLKKTFLAHFLCKRDFLFMASGIFSRSYASSLSRKALKKLG